MDLQKTGCMMNLQNIIDKKLHILKNKATSLSSSYNIHDQYLDNSELFYRGLCISYHKIFKHINDKQNVLDFGAGIGCSQFVYDMSPQKWNLSLADMIDIKWRNNDENKFFNEVRNSMGYDTLHMSNVLKDNFTIDTTNKFDCVIFFRFPPLTHNDTNGKKLREKIKPWITEDCLFIYANSIEHYYEKFDFFLENDYTILECEGPLVVVSF
jgi:hypothetical protein